MKHYKKWTPAQRSLSYRWTMKAIKEGIITEKSKKVCEKCGQDKGIIMLHNENYDATLIVLGAYYKHGVEIAPKGLKMINEALMEICWRCHMILHSQNRNPKACDHYWEEIENGIKFPPVEKHDWGVLRRDHGIF